MQTTITVVISMVVGAVLERLFKVTEKVWKK